MWLAWVRAECKSHTGGQTTVLIKRHHNGNDQGLGHVKPLAVG
ncbi:hypothetical protein [Helicobacter heilmannii]|uniref:Uncharacterized protein n=1 Tax=Helicobacter heilmannii TaxID=35817 RepID=A0A0K2XM46_HELHE|nr:hypothetical protein [Helicobacter heilmannii]CRF46694.1 hypothetical protein HHE014_17180 [Helicobacter heilmannii]CRF50530.1 hypothetical protein HHE06_03630 [Helicobacter heilmannii]CRI34223.1 hypothetical protein HHE01_10690 [Helicobacter heilmannii]